MHYKRTPEQNQSDKEELDRFKKDINLAQFAEKLGYTLYPKKRDASRIALKGNDEKDIILVKLDPRSLHYIYINPYDISDRGTIIDLTMSRLNMGLGEARKYLREHLDGPDIKQVKSEYKIQPSAEKRNTLAARFFEVEPLTDTTFLNQRGITDETLNSKAFRSRIGNLPYIDPKSGKVLYVNTVFPIQDENGIIGLEKKNATANKKFQRTAFGSAKGQGLWISNIPKTGLVKEFHITEDPIDALSAFQLDKKSKSDLSTVYFSTNGELTTGQIQLIQRLIDKHKPKKITLANDNDLAGSRFNINLLGQLSEARPLVEQSKMDYPLDEYSEVKMKLSVRNKYTAVLKVFLTHMETKSGELMVENFLRYVDAMNRECVKSQRSERRDNYQFKVASIGTHNTEIELVFNHNRENLIEIERTVASLRPVPALHIERPVLKDLNEDLLQPEKVRAKLLESGQQSSYGL